MESWRFTSLTVEQECQNRNLTVVHGPKANIYYIVLNCIVKMQNGTRVPNFLNWLIPVWSVNWPSALKREFLPRKKNVKQHKKNIIILIILCSKHRLSQIVPHGVPALTHRPDFGPPLFPHKPPAGPSVGCLKRLNFSLLQIVITCSSLA